MSRGPLLWAAIAAADRFSIAQRTEIAGRLDQADLRVAPGLAVVETCHRVEAYGIGDPPAALPLGSGVPLLQGDEAVRHLARLACGLESAVLGEDQILHQVRVTLSDLCVRRADASLIRAFEVAVAAGRRARAGQFTAGNDLGELAVRWLAQRVPLGTGTRVLVVGSGPMGRLAASAFARRGAAISIASRTPAHARAAANDVHGVGVGLDEAWALAPEFAAVVVALRGAWRPTDGWTSGKTDDDAAVRRFCGPVVDLSVPHALDAGARAELGDAFADVDAIWREAPSLTADGAASDDAYRTVAMPIVDETVASFGAWSAGRASIGTLRALRDRSEEHRAAEVQRLLRRLPDLDPRQRRLVEAFSERLVAGLLHAPSAALREDADGSVAIAAERLFGL